jgi:hypothetical protein
MCFQEFQWCIEMLGRGADQLDQFEDENEFKLCERDAVRLCNFLGSDSFWPVLDALDMDQGRVQERVNLAANKRGLQESLHDMGTRQLHLWLGLPRDDYEGEDYSQSPYPIHPLNPNDWVKLKEVLMPQGDVADNMIPRLIDDMARYMHMTNYKIDRLRQQVRANGASESQAALDWEQTVNKYPFLADCDDHEVCCV